MTSLKWGQRFKFDNNSVSCKSFLSDRETILLFVHALNLDVILRNVLFYYNSCTSFLVNHDS